MNVFEPNTLLLFILFFVPGFVSMKTYDLFIQNEGRKASSYLYDAIAYSAINFALMSWLIAILFRYQFYQKHMFLFAITMVLILFIIPASLGWGYATFCRTEWFKNIAHGFVNRSWDWALRKNKGFWVIVNLTDGTQIAGIFGKDSHASTHPIMEQIFLQEAWALDESGKFTSAVQGAKGVIILGEHIVSVELFEARDK
ncbi:MAG: hypothetical protein HKM04_05660 [Legionellales bacterium]|nr:hypothetical protein [Legionellales bacterium]